METRRLILEKDGVTGYLALADSSHPTPGLLFLHGVTGMSPYREADAQAFARAGYSTFAPDLYGMCGSPFSSFIEEEGRAIQTRTSDAEFVQASRRAFSYLAGLAEIDSSRLAACGHCMGGRIGLHFAASRPEGLRAFIGYYPSAPDLPPTELRPRPPWMAAGEIACPTMTLYGANDEVSLIPVQERIHQALLATGQAVSWHVFAHGGHGFGLTEAPVYDAELADLAFGLALQFLKTELT
jgi:dienelactone hydrolase